MIWIGILFVLVLFALFAAQAALVFGYMGKLWKAEPLPAADEDCKPVAVVLCVRGSDPSLPDCIRSILNLDYPSYEVVFVFDSPEDPGVATVERLIAEPHECSTSMQWIPTPTGTASLKCDAVVHAVQNLGPKPEIIAFVDADTIVTQNWLRELVQPFEDHKVGATTGMRWYEAPDGHFGSLVRAMWNTAAIVQMYWYRIAWGGSLAVRRNAILDTNLLQRWSHAFCEDTMVNDELKRFGLRIEIVPSLHMVNQERCRLSSCMNWVTRQLITTRLYHRKWPLVSAHGLGTSVTLLLCGVLFCVAIWLNHLPLVALLFFSVLAYEIGSLCLLFGINLIARRILKRAGRPLESWGGEMSILYMLTLPVTQCVYAIATVRSLLARHVHWRGIDYKIGRGGQVTMEEYRPYAETSGAQSSEHSL